MKWLGMDLYKLKWSTKEYLEFQKVPHFRIQFRTLFRKKGIGSGIWFHFQNQKLQFNGSTYVLLSA